MVAVGCCHVSQCGPHNYHVHPSGGDRAQHATNAAQTACRSSRGAVMRARLTSWVVGDREAPVVGGEGLIVGQLLYLVVAVGVDQREAAEQRLKQAPPGVPTRLVC